MKTIRDLLIQITQLTSNIEANYPELYTFLLEEPITIPSTKHPEINLTVLKDYLQTLNEELQHHIKTHKTK